MAVTDRSCPSCGRAPYIECATSNGDQRPPHLRRIAATIVYAVIPMLIRLVPVTDRWPLMRTLLAHDAGSKTAGPEPDQRWAPVWQHLLAASNLLAQAEQTLRDAHTYLNLDDLADQTRDLHNSVGRAYQLVCSARNVPGLDVEPGLHLDVFRRKVDHRRGQLVDAELTAVQRPPGATARTITIGYRDHGGFLATTTDGGGEVPSLFWGAAPTPRSAAHTLAGYFLHDPPMLVFDPVPPPAARRLTPLSPQSDISPEGPDVADLLKDRGPNYDAHIRACAHAQKELAGVDPAQYLAERADLLNSTSPQLHHAHVLDAVGAPANRDHDGFVETVQWVRTELVVATDRPVWGEFGDHRPEVLQDILRGLRNASDLEAFTRDLFTPPIHLIRVAAWSGPVYVVGANGNHRVHIARMIGLPWLAASVGFKAIPPSWDLLDILTGDADQPQDAAAPVEQRRDERITLISGLIKRGIVDGELAADPDTAWPTLRCRRLPAPWLLRDAQYAAMANAHYEQRYPGALAHLGIPTGIGTNAAAWTRWLTH